MLFLKKQHAKELKRFLELNSKISVYEMHYLIISITRDLVIPWGFTSKNNTMKSQSTSHEQSAK